MLGHLNPGADFLEDNLSLQVEMSHSNILETLHWFLQMPKHAVLYVAESDNVGVTLILLFSLDSSRFTFITRLIKVDFFGHNNCLDRQHHLQQVTNLRVPILAGIPSPSPQQRQTHLPATIQVRVESHISRPSRFQITFRRTRRITRRQINMILEQTIRIRSPLRPRNERLHNIQPVLISTYKYRVIRVTR